MDAVLIDDHLHVISIVQGKYRQHLGASSEKRADIQAFAQLALTLTDPSSRRFTEFLAQCEPFTADLLRKARPKLLAQGYRLKLYFATTWRVSPTALRDAKNVTRQAAYDTSVDIVAGNRLMTVLRDYLDGAAPPIPSIDLELESGSSVKVNGILKRFDKGAGIESWVFSMRAPSLAAIYEEYGARLFARNIRGFLGEDRPVNKGMIHTLSKQPRNFFYYNNGITIVCDKAEMTSSRGRDVLIVHNPQVINGQQTTRMLAAHSTRSSPASVLVKVIQVPREEALTGAHFETLVARIVACTNWQTEVSAADLRSNDRVQIDLERDLRKLGYGYLRKRQTKAEARRRFGGKRLHLIKKEDFAQAVAGCELDPVVPRSGKDNLFEEDLYDLVFPNSDPHYFLPRYWLFRLVTAGARGKPQRGYTKWLVLNFLWARFGPELRGRAAQRSFWHLCERKREELLIPLARCVNLVYTAALAYYRANRGTGEEAQDVSLFFRSKKGRDAEFASFWRRHSAGTKGKFTRNMREAIAVVKTAAV
jgi:hypothetical protein